ncbi:MAG TPA: hypothetical protein VMG09_16635 [Bacteroidota bacterium]|nr:hypothetical protein [Bacteroidota bacterium]
MKLSDGKRLQGIDLNRLITSNMKRSRDIDVIPTLRDTGSLGS